MENTLFETMPAVDKDKNEWITPKEIIHALGKFDLDPCCAEVMPWKTAESVYTRKDNGLLQPWYGRVFCNPPYSDEAPWIKRLVQHGNGTLFVFNKSDTNLFQDFVLRRADSIFYIRQRVYFYTSAGIKGENGSEKASVLVAYGKQNVEALEYSGLNGYHEVRNRQSIIIIGISPTWYSIVTIAVNNHGDQDLSAVYEMVDRLAPDKVRRNQHWKAKIRQQIQVIRKQKL